MTESARAQSYPCQTCGGKLSFDAARGCLVCAHCGAVRSIAATDTTIGEHDLFEGLATAPRGLGASSMRAARCQECGATVDFSDGLTATRCAFCGSPRVLEQAENRSLIRPESLLPFGVDRARSTQAFVRWIAGLWFRPSDLRGLARVEELVGVYVPYWTFDADVESEWDAEAGFHYEVEETYTDRDGQEKTRRVRRTRWESASGNRHDHFDDVLVCASRGLPPDLANSLRTFDTARLVPYAPDYLAGWRAEEYGLDLQHGFRQAKARMDATQQSRCADDVPGDEHRSLVVRNQYSALTFKHVLLPVWIAAYRYRDRVFRFLVNGQTGEVVGKAPYSWPKILATVVLVAALLGLAYLLSRGHGGDL